ncbi:hypothetical protein SNEBB_004534 [Seison nebaliae]|nr:hypothetical protein SNEBB_004534 [Seison nebaliae]
MKDYSLNDTDLTSSVIGGLEYSGAIGVILNNFAFHIEESFAYIIIGLCVPLLLAIILLFFQVRHGIFQQLIPKFGEQSYDWTTTVDHKKFTEEAEQLANNEIAIDEVNDPIDSSSKSNRVKFDIPPQSTSNSMRMASFPSNKTAANLNFDEETKDTSIFNNIIPESMTYRSSTKQPTDMNKSSSEIDPSLETVRNFPNFLHFPQSSANPSTDQKIKNLQSKTKQIGHRKPKNKDTPYSYYMYKALALLLESSSDTAVNQQSKKKKRNKKK